MFKHQHQSGFMHILYSIGLKPLDDWYMEVKNGHIKRLVDNDLQSSVIEIAGANVGNNFIKIPDDDKKNLSMRLPNLVLQVKNLKKYFTFEIMIIDDKGIRRTFKASNFQTLTRVKPNFCSP